MTESRFERTKAAVLPAVVLLVGGLAAGCGGTAGSKAGAAADATDSIDRPPDPIVTDADKTFNVTFLTTGGQFLVDKLEIEFNRRRGIHHFFGFYRDEYGAIERIPFSELRQVDFLGEMPPDMFDQAIVGREQMNLRQDQAFAVRLTFKDYSQKEFFAIIPKFRGEKDLQLWEYNLSNRNMVVQSIEFYR